MEYVEVGGRRIAFRRVGAGPPLLLLHGAFADSREWERQFDAFSGRFTVVAWDAPGCGGSDDLPIGPFGLGQWAHTLSEFIRAVRLDRPHVLGLSLGSVLALALHAEYPECTRSLVLASAYAGWAGSLSPEQVQQRIDQTLLDLERPIEQVAREFVATLLPADAPPALIEEQVTMVSQARPHTARALVRDLGWVDLRPVLGRVSVPTLLLYGDADVRAPGPVAKAMHAAIPGSTLVQIPGLGHCGHIQAPGQWNDAVLEFLGTAAGRAASGVRRR